MTGAEVKEWREARDISQGQLAKALPMNLRTLQGWERTAKPNGTPPPFMRRALRDLERELTLGTRGARAHGPVIFDDVQHLGPGTLAAVVGTGCEPNPPWTDEGAGEDIPPPSEYNTPPNELSYESDDSQPELVEGYTAPTNVKRRGK